MTLAPASNAANIQTVFLKMVVVATAATEGKAGLTSNKFDPLGAISVKTPQFRVHTAPISEAASVAAGNSISLNFSSGEFGSGLFDFTTLSNLSIHATTNTYNSSNSNNNYSNTTTISGNINAVTNSDQSAALEVTNLSFDTDSLTDSMRSGSVSSTSSVPAATVDKASAQSNVGRDNRDTIHLDSFPANWDSGTPHTVMTSLLIGITPGATLTGMTGTPRTTTVCPPIGAHCWPCHPPPRFTTHLTS